MKKLLSILAITSTTISFSTSVVSCKIHSHDTGGGGLVSIPDIENKIENGNNSIIRGDNLSTDATNATTQKTIFNAIGLTNDEKAHVKITKGTLNDNVDSEVTYNIYDTEDTTIEPYIILTNEIMLQKINKSVTETDWYSKDFSNANNLTLYNKSQLVISHVENESPISNVNLDFSVGYKLANIGEEPEGSVCDYEFKSKIYGIYQNGEPIYNIQTDAASDGANAFLGNSIPGNDNSCVINKYTSSNDKLFAIGNKRTGGDPVIFDITNNTIDEDDIVAQLSSGFESDVTSLKSILYLNGNLYVGTNSGLYVSSGTTGNSYSKISSTNGLDINSIVQDMHGDIILGTVGDGVYASTDNNNFAQFLNTSGETVNPYSLFFDDDRYVYFSFSTGGLYRFNSINLSMSNLKAEPIVTDNITGTTSVKSIIQYDKVVTIMLTNDNLVYYDNETTT